MEYADQNSCDHGQFPPSDILGDWLILAFCLSKISISSEKMYATENIQILLSVLVAVNRKIWFELYPAGIGW